MSVKKHEAWHKRCVVIRKTERNDYAEIAEFNVTKLFRDDMVNNSSLFVNGFIRRMIWKGKQ